MLRLSPSDAAKRKAAAVESGAKKRGSYNCGRCGLPKKGHICTLTGSPVSDGNRLRRALSFDDVDVRPIKTEEIGDYHPSSDSPADDVDDDDLGNGMLPARLLGEVLSRLPPKDLMSAAGVCKGWKDSVGRIWRSAEELRVRVPRLAQVGFVGSVLQKCSSLVRLSLHMESDINATVLACIAFSCSKLEALEITTRDAAVNRITGDALGRFVAEKRSLSSLKIEGCSNLGFLNLSSSSLQVLWLSDLNSLSKSIINCPNLGEISLDFSRQENDCTDLASVMENLGRSCMKLRRIHVASTRLSNPAVLALTGGKLRYLRMLSLILGLKITDAAVASITASFTNLELLDLSGSSISDSGIGMICNVYPDSLSRLLLALCPNITSSGIQFATAQLPRLQLIDCGMSMRHVSSQSDVSQGSQFHEDVDDYAISCEKSTSRLQPVYHKLIIKHGKLRKLSLWGCSSLDALHLNCPQLVDLNLNSCSNLHPERLDLQCPNLEVVHASGCKNMLLQSLAFQDEITADLPCKRLGDGSKRVKAPQFLVQAAGENLASPIRRCAVVAD